MIIHHFMYIACIALVLCFVPGSCYSADQKHPNKAILKKYTGYHLPYRLDADQLALLDSSKPVIIRGDEISDRKGGASVIQDIDAPPHVCMKKLLEFEKYPSMVPSLKHLSVYRQETLEDGSEVTFALFEAGVLAIKVGYFLRLVHRPDMNTLTWTLDYDRKSDFEDSVGHWQVMAHPTKRQWSRVLYSTAAVLPKWLPKFAINFIVKSILVEATTWLKQESEMQAKSSILKGDNVYLDKTFVPVSAEYKEDENGASYEPHWTEYNINEL